MGISDEVQEKIFWFAARTAGVLFVLAVVFEIVFYNFVVVPTSMELFVDKYDLDEIPKPYAGEPIQAFEFNNLLLGPKCASCFSKDVFSRVEHVFTRLPSSNRTWIPFEIVEQCPDGTVCEYSSKIDAFLIPISDYHLNSIEQDYSDIDICEDSEVFSYKVKLCKKEIYYGKTIIIIGFSVRIQTAYYQIFKRTTGPGFYSPLSYVSDHKITGSCQFSNSRDENYLLQCSKD